MEALWATILFSGFALEVIIRQHKSTAASAIQISPAFPTRVAAIMMESKNVP